ncbi:hypothetical protein PLESTB_001396900 [Pleodorina starrii]|uniref:EF-hand domain-containing protein n=1 Tax=Pleodorina starrii TaxID=330485 RepID=A0A9W6BVZ5_9CHLO|nr:hypothetical protein PLESTM_000535400 [Pleodorina starrii]GLC58750.1 hypothetical protein PLESTB_001396900 [Pleodorina starrii]GLC75165.1 hypothetical protein PLESTF_001602200 [Pleodorina starrii]
MTAPDLNVLQQWFQCVDTDGSGLLDAKELRQALDIGGLSYTLAQVHLLVRAFDSKGNQKLDLNEFVELHRFLDAVQTCFSHFARGGSRLSAADAQQALIHMGHRLDGTVMRAVLDRYDTDTRGTFGVEDFLRMCLFLRTAARAFQAFDTGKRGTVQLSLNQLCYAASYLA